MGCGHSHLQTSSTTLTTVPVDLLISWFSVTLDLPIGQVANLHSEVIKVISCQLMIGKTRTSVCHPQGNGQVNEAAILSPDINTCNDNVHYYYVYDNYNYEQS